MGEGGPAAAARSPRPSVWPGFGEGAGVERGARFLLLLASGTCGGLAGASTLLGGMARLGGVWGWLPVPAPGFASWPGVTPVPGCREALTSLGPQELCLGRLGLPSEFDTFVLLACPSSG